jgi:hypothetical protein
VGQIQRSHCCRNVIELARYEDRFNFLQGFGLWASFTIASMIRASRRGTQLPELSGNPGDSLFRIETRSFNLQRGEPQV